MQTLNVLQPIRLGNLELRNRLIVPPMVTYLSAPDGTVTNELIAYAKARAAGGFGLYILEATYVDPAGRGFSRGVGIDEDDKIPGLRQLANAVHAHGGKISVQLHHAGRETSSVLTGQTIVAPSDCPVAYSEEAVHELSVDEIKAIVKRFADGARRAVAAGFDAVMLHGAHGYLLSQFLSLYTNKRTDEYGGSLENRLRLSIEIIHAVRNVVGEGFPVTYRMTVDEGLPGGLTLQESARAAARLSRSGVDALHIVAGNYATPQLIIPPACVGDMVNKARAQVIRDAVGPGFPLTVAGRITNVFQAEELVQDGLATFVAMGRASLADPELPARCTRGAYNTVRTCLGCNDGCIGRTSKELSIGCAINPLTGREAEFEALAHTASPKKVLVIGAGPAGMEAARIAAERGHAVILCEQAAQVGGQFRLAAIPPYKNDIFSYLHHMEFRLRQSGVDLRLSCPVNTALLEQERPDYVFLTTGGNPIQIPFSGLNTLHNTTAQRVLAEGLDELGQRVAVIGGGMVGCETAEFIASTGRSVHIIEMQSQVIGELFVTVRENLLKRLAGYEVSIHTDSKVMRIEDQQVIVAGKDGKEHPVGPVDSVVMALGVRPEASLEQALKERSIPFVKLGDCEKQGNCRRATQSALAAYAM